MSDPSRWLDDGSAPPEVRELLRRAKGAGSSRPLPPESRIRSAALLDRRVALPAAAGILLWLKGVALAAGIAGLGAVVVGRVLVHPAASEPPRGLSATVVSKPTPPPTRLAAAVPSSTPASFEADARATATPTASLATAIAPVRRAPPIPAMAFDSIAREVAMLDRARSLLARDPDAALAALDAHAAAFPSGHMSLERELLAVDALRRLRRVGEARARAGELLERATGSIYEERVSALVESLGSP